MKRWYITIDANGRTLSDYYNADTMDEAIEKAHKRIGYRISVKTATPA